MTLVETYKETFEKYKSPLIPTLEEQLQETYALSINLLIFKLYLSRPLTSILLVGKTKPLFNARVSDLQCIALLEFAKTIPTLEVLDLSYNRIGDDACSAIGQFVEVCSLL